jgi:hypothetical protein
VVKDRSCEVAHLTIIAPASGPSDARRWAETEDAKERPATVSTAGVRRAARERAGDGRAEGGASASSRGMEIKGRAWAVGPGSKEVER